MKLRLFLIFVIVYILAVFGWWLYSLLNFAHKEYLLEHSKIEIISEKISHQSELLFVNEKLKNPTATHQEIFHSIENKLKTLNQEIGKGKTELKFNENLTDFNEAFKIEKSKSSIKSINEQFLSRKRAFISEVIFFGLAVILGVIWVFGKLESLLNLNKMQNNFLLSVTHELKTPLAAIKLSSEMLLHKELSKENKEKVLGQTISNSDRLNELLDNVLLATRIDGKKHFYENNQIKLEELLLESAKTIKNHSDFKGKLTINSNDLNLFGDINSLKLAFSNLFQNSLKYAGDDCHIQINAQKENNKLIITYQDNGPGIPSKELKHIFKKFYRIGDENTRKSKGTGLGLYITEQIFKQHKAIIKAKENDNGALFIIEFKNQNTHEK